MSLSRYRVSTIAIVIAASLLGRAAFADEPTAEAKAAAKEAFAEGMQLRERENLRAALPKFKKAYDLVPTPITALELGKVYVALGLLIEGEAILRTASGMPPRPGESIQAKTAREDADALAIEVKRRIPSLRIALRGVPASSPAKVSIDDKTIPSLTEPTFVNPGRHHVVARLSGREDQLDDLEIAEKEERILTIAFPAAAATSKPVVVESRINPLVWVGFGVAIVGVGLGIGALVAESNAKQCEGDTSYTHDCGPPSAKDWQLIAIGSLAAGGVGLALGVTGLLSPTRIEARKGSLSVRPWVGLNNFGVAGSF